MGGLQRQLPADEAAARADLADYLDTNFGTTEWVDEIEVAVAFEFGRLDSLEASFRDDPADADHALAACNALAVYLYELRDGTGSVLVVLDGELLASRTGPDGVCVRP